MKKIYAINHYNFIDRIVIKKRKEICNIINKELFDEIFLDALDIGSTNDLEYESSNFLIKNLKNIKFYKSISDQEISNDFFFKTLRKSITSEFSVNHIESMRSDLVISNATIEHVGNFNNQKKK